MLLALIFPRAQRASTYDISAERNVWLQSALRSFAIVCDYIETGLFCDRLRSFAIIWKPALSLLLIHSWAEGAYAACDLVQERWKIACGQYSRAAHTVHANASSNSSSGNIIRNARFWHLSKYGLLFKASPSARLSYEN